MPPPIAQLTREMLRNPVEIAVEREAKPATGIRQALYPVSEDLKPLLLLELLRREQIKNVIVFTRTKHRANRLAEFLQTQRISVERIHGNRSQSQRTEALGAFKDGKIQVLVATDIAARGIDVEALSHVLNFDVPNVPEDYIHRVGRTARAELTGDAWTFVSDGERNEMNAIERVLGHRVTRRTLEGFDYQQKANQRLEIPIGERIAAIRARKAEERARAKVKAERKAAQLAAEDAKRTGKAPKVAPASPERRTLGRGPAPSNATPPAGERRPFGRGPAPANAPASPSHRPAHQHRPAQGETRGGATARPAQGRPGQARPNQAGRPERSGQERFNRNRDRYH
jgi:ATP-dependent RNA helicase RhlE